MSMSGLTAAGYLQAETNDPFIDASETNSSASSTKRLSACKRGKQGTSGSLMVHNVDERSWRAEGKRNLSTIVEKVSCLSAPIGSQPDAEQFQNIKAPTGLAFLRSCVRIDDRQDTNPIVRNSVFFRLHSTQTSKRSQTILEPFKQEKKREVSFATLLPPNFYEMKYGPIERCKICRTIVLFLLINKSAYRGFHLSFNGTV